MWTVSFHSLWRKAVWPMQTFPPPNRHFTRPSATAAVWASFHFTSPEHSCKVEIISNCIGQNTQKTYKGDQSLSALRLRVVLPVSWNSCCLVFVLYICEGTAGGRARLALP
ncbi:unnamed protein product [Boreogadus saida]